MPFNIQKMGAGSFDSMDIPDSQIETPQSEFQDESYKMCQAYRRSNMERQQQELKKKKEQYFSHGFNEQVVEESEDSIEEQEEEDGGLKANIDPIKIEFPVEPSLFEVDSRNAVQVKQLKNLNTDS